MAAIGSTFPTTYSVPLGLPLSHHATLQEVKTPCQGLDKYIFLKSESLGSENVPFSAILPFAEKLAKREEGREKIFSITLNVLRLVLAQIEQQINLSLNRNFLSMLRIVNEKGERPYAIERLLENVQTICHRLYDETWSVSRNFSSMYNPARFPEVRDVLNAYLTLFTYLEETGIPEISSFTQTWVEKMRVEFDAIKSQLMGTKFLDSIDIERCGSLLHQDHVATLSLREMHFILSTIETLKKLQRLADDPKFFACLEQVMSAEELPEDLTNLWPADKDFSNGCHAFSFRWNEIYRLPLLDELWNRYNILHRNRFVEGTKEYAFYKAARVELLVEQAFIHALVESFGTGMSAKDSLGAYRSIKEAVAMNTKTLTRILFRAIHSTGYYIKEEYEEYFQTCHSQGIDPFQTAPDVLLDSPISQEEEPDYSQSQLDVFFAIKNGKPIICGLRLDSR